MQFVRRVTGEGMWQQLRPGLPALAATVLMAVVLLPLGTTAAANLPPIAALAVLIAAGMATYFAGLYGFGRGQWDILAGAIRTVRSGRRVKVRPSAESS
jgi:hypothetical protein